VTNRRQIIDAVEVTDSGIHVVRLKHIFDASSVSEFEKVLAYLLTRKHFRIVVDLAQVDFIASAGWGAFTAEFRNVRNAGGDIRLAGMNPDVQDVFFLLELDSFINAYDNVDAAIASFEAEAQPAAPKEETAAKAADRDAAEAEPLAQERDDDSYESVEAEPIAFAVAEVYDPAYRSPLALGPGNMKPRPPAYEPLVSANDAEEESWEMPEEVETEGAELAAFTPEEEISNTAPEMSWRSSEEFDSTAVPLAQEGNQSVEKTAWTNEEEQTHESSSRAAHNNRHFEHGNSEEWPEAQTEENVTLDDFELQDIHDPWILEEIDTLPEEGEIDETDWSGSPALENERAITPFHNRRAVSSTRVISREPAVPRPLSEAPLRERESSPAKPRKETAASAKLATASSERTETQLLPVGEPHASLVPRSSAAQVQSSKPSLADKVKAAGKLPAAPKTPSAAGAKVNSEGEHVDMVRRIVSEHPHYGPAMIQKFFETRTDPPMQVSRSTVYRWLRLAGLNTREQRLEFAGKASL